MVSKCLPWERFLKHALLVPGNADFVLAEGPKTERKKSPFSKISGYALGAWCFLFLLLLLFCFVFCFFVQLVRILLSETKAQRLMNHS